MSSLVHRETIPLRATPAQVRAFIMTPQRILDYYPQGLEAGEIEPGRSLYCRGRSGVSLLELDPSQSDENTLVVHVTTALGLEPPYTAERIRAAVFFTMTEDWQLEAAEQGCKLTKTWRDVKKQRLRFMPMGFIVRRSARHETPVLQSAWNRAAAASA